MNWGMHNFDGWRRWLLRLVLVVAVPLLVLGAAELVLRATGYGYSTAFLLKRSDGTGYSTNDKFGWRYHCRETPTPFVLSSPKPRGTVRIFVFGESAVYGTPDPAFSFSRILEVMLRAQYPRQNFEIINTGMMGINSHVIRDITRECARHEPDLFIVYMGNNELMGAYGVGATPERFSFGLSRTVIRTALWARATKLGQLLDRWLGPRGWQKPPLQDEAFFRAHWVNATDRRRVLVQNNFRANLDDLCKLARANQTKLILSTVAVNLRDCPPSGALHRRDLTAAELARWETAYRQGVLSEDGGQWTAALQHYRAAEAIDDQFADLQFRLGTTYAALGDFQQSSAHFVRACDYDAMPFRTDSGLNAIVRETARRYPSADVVLVDSARLLAPDNQCPGASLFYEHVHLNFHGNYELAKLLLPSVSTVLGAQLGPRSGVLPSERNCADELAYTAWDELEFAWSIVRLTERPPFTTQLNHARRQTQAVTAADKLQRDFQEPQRRQALAVYQAALQRRPNDLLLRSNFAELLAALRISLTPTPIDPQAAALLERGNVFFGQGRFADAVQTYREALALATNAPNFHNNLGAALLRVGETNEAVARFETALQLAPDLTSAHMNLAVVLTARRRHGDAIAHLRRVLELQPAFPEAARRLAWLLATTNDPALRNGTEAVRLAEQLCQKPEGRTLTSLDALAAAYAEVGRFDDAVRIIEEARALAAGGGALTKVLVLAQRQELYKARRAYREP